MKCCSGLFAACCSVLLLATSAVAEGTGQLRGVVVDATTRKPLPCRLYIQSLGGQWYWAKSASSQGSAVEYRKQRSESCVEIHTTLSAHPFVASLPHGQYTVTVERGKEYFPVVEKVEVSERPVDLEINLHRWINMAERGWYSGDTHVHRSLEELPNVVLAEDLNVALPLTNWVTTAYTPPGRGNKNAVVALKPQLIEIDPRHVVYPINTEYEIFSVDKRRHTLGAVFVLNHQQQLQPGVPPVRPVAQEARRQGALLDLDKHSWPWSLMLVPIMNVDLFELSNNHIWRTKFHFHSWTIDTKPAYLDIETNDRGFTERGWTDFGFGVYYTLLNCGFRMRPTAGTASGVHPVPLGFSRVYVQLQDGFSYENWIKGLDDGRSFVTTGPMLFLTFNGKPPGHTFKGSAERYSQCHVTGAVESGFPVDRIEVVVNGRVVQTLKPTNQKMTHGRLESPIDLQVDLAGSSWVALRCFEQRDKGRTRFAHTSPVHFEIPGKPLRPRRAEVQYLIRRMQEEIIRNQNVLRDADLQEFREALSIYQRIAERAQ